MRTMILLFRKYYLLFCRIESVIPLGLMKEVTDPYEKENLSST